MRAFTGLLVLALAITAVACRIEHRSVSIDPLPRAESLTVAVPSDWRDSYGNALLAAEPARLRLVEEPDPAAAAAAVREGRALLALTRAGHAVGLTAEPFDSAPLSFLVPVTFPVDDLRLDQARALAAGQVTNWRALGGPPLAVRAVLWGNEDDALAATALLGLTPVASRMSPANQLTAGGLALHVGDSPSPALKPLRLDGRLPDDEGYPWRERYVVAGGGGSSTLVRAVAGVLRARLERERSGRVVLDAVGDIMLGRSVGEAMRERGLSFPFDAVQPLLAGSDLRVANLELPLTERGVPATKRYVFRAPPAAAGALRAAGFTLLSLANNHMMDYGPEGLLDTLAALGQAGIAHAGAGRSHGEAHAPAVVTVNGLRIAFLAYVNVPDDAGSGFSTRATAAGPSAPGVAWGTVEAVRRDVAAARAAADLVIVSVHAGFEYTAMPNAVQRELARAAVDSGAALVLGSHPHVLQGLEFYRGVPIAYSLGNFVFDLDDDDRRQPGLPSVLSAVLRVTLDRSGVRALRFLPVVIDERVGRPVPASGEAARPVLERLYQVSVGLNDQR